MRLDFGGIAGTLPGLAPRYDLEGEMMWVTSRRFLLVMELINSCRSCIERGAKMQAHARIIMMIMMPEAMLLAGA